MKKLVVEHGSIHYELKVVDADEVLKGGSIMNKVKMYRTAIGFTQKQMAEYIGVHENTYRALEENCSKFTVEQINKFMALINKYDAEAKAADIFPL